MSNQKSQKVKASSMVIKFTDGSTQVISPSSKFDGSWHELAEAIAQGKKHTYILH